MKKIIAIVLAVAFALSFTGCGETVTSQPQSQPASLGDDTATTRTEPLVISLGCQGDMGYGDAVGDFYNAFSAYITEQTGGMITFESFPNGQLGSENDMLDQVMSDTLDGAFLSVNVLATVFPDLYALSLPFAFSSEDEYWAMFEDEAFYTAVENTIEANGLVKFIGPVNAYFRGLQNVKHPITCLADMHGLKLRVMSGEIYSDIYQALGCRTATVSMGELYSALEQGVVEGEDMNFTMFSFLKYYETEKYMTELNAMIATNPLIISTRVWDQLSEEEKAIFEQAYELGEEASKKAFDEYKATFYDDLEAEGVDIVTHDELTEEAVQEFRDATAGVWDKYSEKVSSEFWNTFTSTREKVCS